MGDKSSQIVLSALTRAAAETGGVPLHGSKTTPGLFPTTALGKQAAQRCCDEGYLSLVEAPSNGKPASGPICTLTDKGMSYLLGQVSPKEVLEDFVRVLESREDKLVHLVGLARQMHQGMTALKENVASVLSHLRTPAGELKTLFQAFRQDSPAASDTAAPPAAASPVKAILSCLASWTSSLGEDCPLPDLFRKVEPACPGLTIGSFHDALRGLVRDTQVYLHPWTGPLYAIPEPPFALLIGHEVGYYASLREPGR